MSRGVNHGDYAKILNILTEFNTNGTLLFKFIK